MAGVWWVGAVVVVGLGAAVVQVVRELLRRHREWVVRGRYHARPEHAGGHPDYATRLADEQLRDGETALDTYGRGYRRVTSQEAEDARQSWP